MSEIIFALLLATSPSDYHVEQADLDGLYDQATCETLAQAERNAGHWAWCEPTTFKE